MRRFFSIITLMLMALMSNIAINAQNNATTARVILDKTSKIIGRKGGISASFSLSHPKMGNVSGSIAVKGNKFNARTPQAIVWYNGKTQWTYMKKNNEVNVSTPTAAQQQLFNPYTFIHIYKKGYNLSVKTSGQEHNVHLVAQNRSKSIQEMYITINKRTNVPSRIKMKQKGLWYDIRISKFSATFQPDNAFTFNAKEFPTAEGIDLR